MFSTFVSVIFAVGLLSVGSGMDTDEKSAYEAAFHCIIVGWITDVSDIQGKGGHATVADKMEAGCIIFEARFNTSLATQHKKRERCVSFNTVFHILKI